MMAATATALLLLLLLVFGSASSSQLRQEKGPHAGPQAEGGHEEP